MGLELTLYCSGRVRLSGRPDKYRVRKLGAPLPQLAVPIYLLVGATFSKGISEWILADSEVFSVLIRASVLISS